MCYSLPVLTVKACGPIKEAPGSFTVVIWDDAMPFHEGEIVVRVGTPSERFMEVASATVRARTGSPAGSGRINARFLRGVPFGRWITLAVAVADDLRQDRDVTIWTRPTPDAPIPEPSRDPDYLGIATLYRALVRTAEGGPVEALAAELGVPVFRAHQWLMRARLLGLLGPIAPRRHRTPAWAQDEEEGD